MGDQLFDEFHSIGWQEALRVPSGHSPSSDRHTPVHHDDDRYDDKVDILVAKAAADPTVVVADWRVVAWAHKSWFRADGVHYVDAGWVGLAQFMVDAADANDPAAG